MLRAFLIELLIYAVLVVGYFFLVLHFLGEGLHQLESRHRYTYAGVAVMSPQLVASVKRGEKAPLAPHLYRAAGQERLSGELFTGLWQDVGTPERVAELAAQLASRT